MTQQNHIPSLNMDTLAHFGLAGTGTFDSPKAQKVRAQLRYNIEQGQITLLAGRYESGKTMLVRQLMRSLANRVNFINVQTFDDRKIPMPTILSAIVDELSTEGVRRDVMARSKQAVRLLGKKMVNEGKPNCVVIDNTPDRLQLDTMNTIKLLMEADYMGYSPVTSFIILCWPEFCDRLTGRKDIAHRVQQIQLDARHGWFTLPDRLKYLREVFGEAISEGARKRIANLHTLPGDMNAYVVELMQKAQRAGYDKLNDKIVQPSLKERYDANKARYGSDYNYRLIAETAGVGRSTVQLAIESEPDTPSTRTVRKAMDELDAGLQMPDTGGHDAVAVGSKSQQKKAS